MRSLPILPLSAMALAMACAAPPKPSESETAPMAEADERPTQPPESEPEPAVDPEPEPEPEPPLPVAPDGTQAIRCDAAPEGMACVEGGPFVRGDDDGPENARPQATVWLQTFYMDLYEITYEQWKACEKEKKCPRSGPRYTDFDHPKMPIQGVSWFEARTYCQAHGKDLPTEAQWEKAARGTEGALYSWGDEPVTCERAIIKDASGRSCGLEKQFSKPEVGRPWDVGSRPAGVYGLHDMIGNSWEWVLDWYSRSYAKCGDACTGVDPKGPCDGAEKCPGHSQKIIRGGSWYWDETRATAVYRRAHFPANEPYHHFGFRCAAAPEQAEQLRRAADTP
jgi:formylglycine-generating enzyme required for sulfatase activity